MKRKGVIIKIGGSLMDTAGRIIREIEHAETPSLLIPGGGKFANEVRAANLDDNSAHWNAICSMNRYGRFLSTFGIKTTETLKIPESGMKILLPERILKEEDPLPHSWEVTSDSIALWIADKLQVPLLLVKSRTGTLNDGLVDIYFSILQKETKAQIHLACGRVDGEVKEELTRITATLL